MIYFDNAATSYPKPPQVLQAFTQALTHFGNPGRGFYPLSLDAAKSIYTTREQLAQLFHVANPLDIALTSGATESLNMVVDQFIDAKDHVITTVFEHNSVLRPLYKKGCALTIIGMDEFGLLDYEALEAALQPNTKAIVCTHGSNFTGNVLDIARIGAFCQAHHLLFIVDAAQTAGFLPIDVQAHHIDVLCFTGHKSLLGPQGTGGIALNDSQKFNLHPIKVGGSGAHSFQKEHSHKMPDCFEAGTLNSHSFHCLSATLPLLTPAKMAHIQVKELALTTYFYEKLKKIDGIAIYGNFTEAIRCPVVSFNLKDYAAHDVALELYEQGDIACRSGTHCAPLIHQRLGLETQGAVRFSFSFHNTTEEVDVALEILRTLATNS